MKRLFIAAAGFLLALSISSNVLAHSHFEGSNPADGDLVTEPLNEIVLTFDGQIEQGSLIDITTTDNEKVELQDIIINESTLTGTIAEPLPNNDYQANWSIVSADGHPLEGEFSFTVNVPVSESEEEVTEEPSEAADSPEESTVDEEEVVSEDNELETESSSMSIILIVILVILVAGGLFLLTKRKK